MVEENTIVSEITFGESSSGAAIVQGSFISGDATGARISGPFRNQSSENSREQTIRKGRQRVNALANAMRLPERLAEAGVRYFTLAVANNFIRGRRSQYVVATCLYIVCRYEKTSHMLIDFSDLLQINVFVLGSTFLKFVKTLHINLPLVDPSLYITRFAAMLEFGEDTHKVASDATRLVARMKRDWIDLGRRPAGICGACLIIAARMNNYRRSLAEIVHVVKVAESTVQERLMDFSQTQSAALTVDDFKNVWLERSENPPAFDREKRKKEKLKKRRRAVSGEDDSDTDSTENETNQVEADEEAAIRTLAEMKSTADEALFKKPYPVSTQSPSMAVKSSASAYPEPSSISTLTFIPLDQSNPQTLTTMSKEADAALDSAIQSEVAGVLDSEALLALEAEELARRAEQEKLAPDDHDDSLADVDDDEIDSVMLDPASVAIKTQVWMQNNFDYLAAQEQKRLKEDTDRKHGIRVGGGSGPGGPGGAGGRRKKRRTKPRDSSAPDLPASPAESARQMLAERTFSRKINYDAFKSLFSAD